MKNLLTSTAARRWARAGLAVLALLLAAAALADYRRWAAGRDALAEILTGAGLAERQPEVLDRVIHERTLHHAQLLTARALVYDVLDAAPASDPRKNALVTGSPEWEAAVDRLGTAADLARQALEAQAGDYEAAMLLGASLYLERSAKRDPRLVSAAPEWEVPLRAALTAAPGKNEARRLLAGAYLELWRFLSPAKRQLTRELLTGAFAEDPAAFQALAPVWLETAEDLDEAFSVIPERVAEWTTVERIYAESHRFEAFRRAHGRRLAVLLTECEQQLEEGAKRLRLGDYFRGRSLLLQVVARAPLERRFAPLVTRALELYPPGLHGVAAGDALRGWLRFTFELYRLGESILPPRVVGRLASAVGELPAHEGAFAALLSGDLAHAERFERLGDVLSAPAWGPYLAAKTNWLLERQRLEEAAQTLDRAGRTSRESVDHALAAVRLARAQGGPANLAVAEEQLAEYRKKVWSASEWRFRGQRATLALLPAEAAAGIVMTVNRVPRSGAVVGLYWDGQLLALEALDHDAEITLEVEVDERLHLLEFRVVAGGQILPGRVALL